MVDRDYMLKQPSGPSAPKLFLDTKLVPAVVNMLGGLEVGLAQASARSRVSTTAILTGAAGLALVGAYFSVGRVRGRTQRRDDPMAG